MLKPAKLVGGIHVREQQLNALAERARNDSTKKGFLAKKSINNNNWKTKYFILYQNILFYFENDTSTKLLGILFLEGCYCNAVVDCMTSLDTDKPETDNALEVCYRKNVTEPPERLFALKANSDIECTEWINAINGASFAKLQMAKEMVEHKHFHILRILESERTSKWHHIQQCEELEAEVKKLRTELVSVKRESKVIIMHRTVESHDAATMADTSELQKIKKVQSFFRGWLCRRRWKQIVEQYINSPHAENMRTRNKLMFKMVEAEEEYLEQLEILVECFMKPCKLAASSKKPPCTHNEVNSIFLNIENVLFLHQIFLKGLITRMESWPSLVLGDLFSLLLPMLSIYQEYIRNHNFSMQILTECKQRAPFQALLERLESKKLCRGCTVDLLLAAPMHQISRYIITLNKILAHTPHEHVERESLTNSKQKLDELSHLINDEVSATENLRINLSVERMIVDECDVILDVNQVFIKKGNLIQLSNIDNTKHSKCRHLFEKEKEKLRYCFLFSNNLIVTTRYEHCCSRMKGKLRLVPTIGKIRLADTTLIEDPSDDDKGTTQLKFDLQSRDFKLIVDFSTNRLKHEQVYIHLLAPTVKDKAAWISDISQCIENIHMSDMLKPPIHETCSATLLQSIKDDPKLFKDESDIIFNRPLNSGKVPQIRYASLDQLLQRLTDLRLLSIDFLNTFLLTYPVFTDSIAVLNALREVYYNTDYQQLGSLLSLDDLGPKTEIPACETKISLSPTRRTSGASSVSGYFSEISCDRDRTHSYDSSAHRQWKSTLERYEEESLESPQLSEGKKCDDDHRGNDDGPSFTTVQVHIHGADDTSDNNAAGSNSSETLTDVAVMTAPGSSRAIKQEDEGPKDLTGDYKSEPAPDEDEKVDIEIKIVEEMPESDPAMPSVSFSQHASCASRCLSIATNTAMQFVSRLSVPSRRESMSFFRSYYGIKRSIHGGDQTARSRFHQESPQRRSKAGVVITSARYAKRRSSTKATATAFAIATSASSNPRDICPSREGQEAKTKYKESLIDTACTMRVLNVLRHWISKYYHDFENEEILKTATIAFLDDIVTNPNLQPVEYKSALQLLTLLNEQPKTSDNGTIYMLLTTSIPKSSDSIDTLSALEVAEQMAVIDHHILTRISRDEFLGQAWMKRDKETKAPHILMVTKRFNELSSLVGTEILTRKSIHDRVLVIEKWIAVADISRCLNNYNGVMQICAAFVGTAVYRMKKTWDKVPKSAKDTLEKLQKIVSPDGQFRALRDAVHRCDPPCIPFLGIYLTELSFIEEGTPTITEDGLLNFSKMRMIAHVIRQIRHFQQTPYNIQLIPKVDNYLLDTSWLMSDDQLYGISLELEPRAARRS